MIAATKAGRYEILGELGRGGMGVVYRAKDPLIGRTVAVKTIRLSVEGTKLSRADLLERFETEVRAAGLLTHPNIVVIYDAGETDGLYYITMELLNGKSLQALLDAGEKFPLPRLLRIMEQVCSALQFAHDHHVVHRDIKPANIMLLADDLVKITDFGTAKILQYGAVQQTSAMGTPGYMSPEQVKGKAVDGRTDVFSLGVMLYEMTTGQKPFQGQDIATVLYHILSEEPVPPNKLNPNIPAGVSSTILKALAKSPYLRYENCRELLEDLKNYRPGETAAGANAAISAKQTSERLGLHEPIDRDFNALMPQIPGIEARPTPRAELRLKPPAPAADTNAKANRAEATNQYGGVYAGPPKPSNSATLKRVATIGASAILLLVLGSFAVKTIGRMQQSGSESLPLHENSTPPTPTQTAAQNVEPESAQKPAYVSQSTPEVAKLAELAQPWTSKRFFFRSLMQSKYVPAMIVRLPGPAGQSKSYWAFSLEAPYNQCELAYIDDLAKLSSDYGFAAEHAMVVNPCSHAVFDPLQLKEVSGNVFVRGAIVHGYDPRPPFAIEVKVTGNQIQALAME